MCISSDILIFSSPILRRLVSMRQGLTASPPPPTPAPYISGLFPLSDREEVANTRGYSKCPFSKLPVSP